MWFKVRGRREDTVLMDSKSNSNISNEKENKLTFEELFKDYSGEPFDSDIQNLEPVGHEKW